MLQTADTSGVNYTLTPEKVAKYYVAVLSGKDKEI